MKTFRITAEEKEVILRRRKSIGGLNFKKFSDLADYFKKRLPNCTYRPLENVVWNINVPPNKLRQILKKDGWVREESSQHGYDIFVFNLKNGGKIYFEYNYSSDEGNLDWID